MRSQRSTGLTLIAFIDGATNEISGARSREEEGARYFLVVERACLTKGLRQAQWADRQSMRGAGRPLERKQNEKTRWRCAVAGIAEPCQRRANGVERCADNGSSGSDPLTLIDLRGANVGISQFSARD